MASILEIVEEEARKQGGAQVRAIGVRLGEFTGVVREALEFAFEALKPGTLASEATLELEIVPLDCECGACGWRGRPPDGFTLFCPECRAVLRITAGREMLVDYIEVWEATPCNVSP